MLRICMRERKDISLIKFQDQFRQTTGSKNRSFWETENINVLFPDNDKICQQRELGQ